VDPGCKAEFARLLGIERSNLYRCSERQNKRDQQDIDQLVVAHLDNPRYGVRRLAYILNWSLDKTRRIRTLAGVMAYCGKKKGKRVTQKSEISAPPNLLRQHWALKDPKNPRKGYSFAKLTDPALKIWAQDFTYIKHNGRYCFLAATMRLASRDIVGWAFSRHHDKDLVCSSLRDALLKHENPNIIHNDQGSEYLSAAHAKLCEENDIQMSASDPGSPWQNGYMERFFNTFKDEIAGRLRHAKTEEEVYQIIARWIYEYNNKRIHGAIRMTPAKCAELLFPHEKQNIEAKALTRKSFLRSRGAKSLLDGEPALAPLQVLGQFTVCDD